MQLSNKTREYFWNQFGALAKEIEQQLQSDRALFQNEISISPSEAEEWVADSLKKRKTSLNKWIRLAREVEDKLKPRRTL